MAPLHGQECPPTIQGVRTFADVLVGLMDEQGVSVNELGRRLGHQDGGRVRRWRRGEVEPRYSAIGPIAEALGVEPWRFLQQPSEDAAASAPLAAEGDPMTDPWPPELPHADQQATEDLPPPERRHGGDRRRGAG